MSLQRRLLVYLLVCAPVVWIVALVISIFGARHEVNELFDSEMIRLARQMQITMQPGVSTPFAAASSVAGDSGEADVNDLAVAVWDKQGHRLIADREGVLLPWREDSSGFTDVRIDDDDWRVYYLQSQDGAWLVAVGQRLFERDEVVFGLSFSQILPWLLMLPVLLVAMAWAVRRSLAPLHQLTGELQARHADDLRAMPPGKAPAELQPMVEAINALLHRIRAAFERERRFTADAAHELRTPLAVLRAQWDVVRRSTAGDERQRAESLLSAGIDRLDRLVTQMLALSRVEARAESRSSSPAGEQDIAWTPVVEQAINDCLPLAERRGVELAVEWPMAGRAAQHPFPVLGDPGLMNVLMRNLLDNAVRYAVPGSTVQVRVLAESLEVENDGAPLPAAQLARMGERFYRPDGQQEGGSGLGLSIVRRIAELHRLQVRWQAGAAGRGLKVTLGAQDPAGQDEVSILEPEGAATGQTPTTATHGGA